MDDVFYMLHTLTTFVAWWADKELRFVHTFNHVTCALSSVRTSLVKERKKIQPRLKDHEVTNHQPKSAFYEKVTSVTRQIWF